MDVIPRLTSAEWRSIAPVLPTGKAMRQRHDDRDVVDALFYAEAMHCSLEDVPRAYGIGCRALRTRQGRWREAGIWAKLLDRGETAIARMRREIGKDDLLEQCAKVFGWDRL
jgi:transposase